MINDLANLFKTKDISAYEHSLRVAKLSLNFSTFLNKNYDYNVDTYLIYQCGLLHDIGKMFLDKDILYSNRKLSNTEFEYIKKHTILGYDYVKNNSSDISNKILMVIKYHHLGVDNTGYPVKEDILTHDDRLYVNIITICDIYDALINKRSYKNSLTIEETFEIMDNMSNKLDTYLYNKFKTMILSV